MESTVSTVFRAVFGWLRSVGPDVFIIFIVAWVVYRLLNRLLGQIIHHSIKPHRFTNKRDLKLREDTLFSLSRSAIKLIVWTIAGLLVFNKLFPSINLAALGASAGILGIVIGIGSQSLIKDFIAGIFILLENQYRVGDVVSLYCPNSTNEVTGKVIQISLRTTTLRDDEGGLNTVPNGTINRSTNLTFDYAQVNITLKIELSTNLDSIKTIVDQLAQDMSDDINWKKKIIKGPAYLGIKSLDKDGITVAINCKSAPAEQRDVEREIKYRLLILLKKHKINLA